LRRNRTPLASWQFHFRGDELVTTVFLRAGGKRVGTVVDLPRIQSDVETAEEGHEKCSRPIRFAHRLCVRGPSISQGGTLTMALQILGRAWVDVMIAIGWQEGLGCTV